MFIANIAYQRAKPIPEYRSFGSLWYDTDSHHASILLKGFRIGQFFAKPFDKVDEPPYLEWDIVIAIGFKEGVTTEKDYLPLGWLWTCNDQRGTIYNGVIEVDPWPTVVLKEIREDNPDVRGKRQGVMLNIQLVDKGGNENAKG
jgi:hypothetical protein